VFGPRALSFENVHSPRPVGFEIKIVGLPIGLEPGPNMPLTASVPSQNLALTS